MNLGIIGNNLTIYKAPTVTTADGILQIKIAGLTAGADPLNASVILVEKLKEVCAEQEVRRVIAAYSDLNNTTNNQFYAAIPATMTLDKFWVPFEVTLTKPNWYGFDAEIQK